MLQSAGFTQNAPGLATDEGSGLGASVLLENELVRTCAPLLTIPNYFLYLPLHSSIHHQISML